MCERNEQEIAEHLMKDFSDFIKGCAEKYNVGHGMFIVSLSPDNADTMVGSAFGNVKTYDEKVEKRMREVALQTIEGSSESAMKRKTELENKKKQIAEKVADVVTQMMSLEEKKQRAWELAKKANIIVDGKLNKKALEDFVDKVGGDKNELEDFTKIMKEMVEDHKDD